MLHKKMTTNSSHALKAKVAFALLIAFAFVLAHSTTTYAKGKRPNYGLVQITTLPTPFPVMVDGESRGETSTTGREIELAPGAHTVVVVMPNGNNWTRTFDVVAGRKHCIALNYRPKKIVIEKSPCPYPVNISAPATVNDGDQITFTSDVAYGGSSALNYTWTVSPASAQITNGAGTPTITVDSTRLGGKSVTAILVVDDGSGERNCRQTAQASTNVNPPPPPIISTTHDEFPFIQRDDAKARLDNFVIQLQQQPDAKGYVIVYAGRTSPAGQADRLGTFARDYLVNERGFDPNRLVIMNGGYREAETFELWLVPTGATPPQATPTLQASQVQPAPEAKPRRSRRRR